MHNAGPPPLRLRRGEKVEEAEEKEKKGYALYAGYVDNVRGLIFIA